MYYYLCCLYYCYCYCYCYIYIYTHTLLLHCCYIIVIVIVLSLSLYIYIYIYKEREREMHFAQSSSWNFGVAILSEVRGPMQRYVVVTFLLAQFCMLFLRTGQSPAWRRWPPEFLHSRPSASWQRARRPPPRREDAKEPLTGDCDRLDFYYICIMIEMYCMWWINCFAAPCQLATGREFRHGSCGGCLRDGARRRSREQRTVAAQLWCLFRSNGIDPIRKSRWDRPQPDNN